MRRRDVQEKKEQMVAITIDFKKAYNSIKRETMVQILKEFRIGSNIIDFIVRIYIYGRQHNDTTREKQRN